jgi:hypothetical protein
MRRYKSIQNALAVERKNQLTTYLRRYHMNTTINNATKAQELQVKVMALIAEGKTMEEALIQVLAEAAPKKREIAPEDRAEFITTIDDLQELSLAIKCAFGKKSKAVGKFYEYADFTQGFTQSALHKEEIMKHYSSMTADDFDRIVRYETEIKAGQSHYNKIILEITKSQEPFKKAVEHNMSASGLIQMLLDIDEPAMEKTLASLKAKAKLTNSVLKTLINAQSIEVTGKLLETLQKLPDGVLESYKTRVKNHDQRVIKFTKVYNLITKERTEKKEVETK